MPEANMFKLFPYLFRAKRPKGLVGFEDLFQKVIEMGLSDFIYKKPNTFKAPSANEKSEKKDFKDNNWWYLD
jgi:hypothetical protein